MAGESRACRQSDRKIFSLAKTWDRLQAHGIGYFMERTSLKTIPKNSCQGKVISLQSHKITPEFCWSCGHYAEKIGKNCACCSRQITRKDEKIKKIKDRLDDLCTKQAEPEFRFYTEARCFWIKQKDLQEYKDLSNIDKQEKYYWYIKNLVDNDRLTWVLRL